MSWLDRAVEGLLRRLMGEFPDPDQRRRLRRTERVARVLESRISRSDELRAHYRTADARIAAHRDRGRR